MFRLIAGLVLCVAIAGAAFGYGFVVRDQDDAFVTRWIAKIDRKLDEIRGLPLPAERAVERIESTFIRFSGSLYPLPDSHWDSGGGLTVWDDALLLVDARGQVLRFEEGRGLRPTFIETPENGYEDYVALAETPEYSDRVHKPHSLRFNDILFMETDEFRGLILSYSFFDRERVCYGNRVARLAVPADVDSPEDFKASASDWEVILETEPCLGFRPTGTALEGIQAGGRMALHSDGRIILGAGDFAMDGIESPDVGLMDPNVLYGKILAIDVTTGDFEVMAVGHRNVQGVAVDREGEIWTIEHGVRGGDELNHIQVGENHGWPEESLGTLYSGQPLPLQGEVGRHDRYDRPAFAWLPSAGTSALAAIDNFHPAWDGGLLAGSLSSPEYGQSLYHIRTDGETVVFVERIRLDRRIRYVQQFGDRLAVWLDPTDLLILDQESREDPLVDALVQLRADHSEDIASWVEATLRTCNECHSYEQSVHAAGPSLNGIVGKEIAASPFGGYSDALRAKAGIWDEASLAAYLSSPQTFAPGTVMPSMNLRPGAELDALISTLRSLDTVRAEHLKY